MEYIFCEEWKQIIYKNIPTRYSVSNYGDVRNDETGKILKAFRPKKKFKTKDQALSKYRYVRLVYEDNGKKITKFVPVHRLVAIAFVPIPKKYLDLGLTAEDLDVDHIYDNNPRKFDSNYFCNLQWLTRSENVKKGHENGVMDTSHIGARCGEENAQSKYNEEIVRKICELLEKNELNMKDISKKVGCKKGFVNDIRIHRTWVHISSEYNFDHYDRVEGVDYPPGFSEKIDKLILDGYKNKEICNMMEIKYDKTIRAYISSHRKKLGKLITKRSYFTKEFICKMDTLIREGKSNKEIKDELGIWTSTFDNLIYTHRSQIKTGKR